MKLERGQLNKPGTLPFMSKSQIYFVLKSIMQESFFCNISYFRSNIFMICVTFFSVPSHSLDVKPVCNKTTWPPKIKRCDSAMI